MVQTLIEFIRTLTNPDGLRQLLTSAWAQDYGRVLSSTPVLQSVAVPRQVCSTESVRSDARPSAGGAALGAIAGGAIGNAIGQGGGRAAATALGVFGGAVLGSQIAGNGHSQFHQVQHCSTQTFMETRPAGYQIVYEYAGKQYSVHLAQDPGPTVRLQISPAEAVVSQAAPAPSVTYVQPAAPVIYSQTVFVPAAPHWVANYPIYRYPPPVGVNLNFGYNNRRHPHPHPHPHWR